MKPPRKTENELILGLVSVSDRASRGVYRDEGIPALEAWMRKAVKNPLTIHKRLIPDERFDIEKTLRELVDIIGCDLILTTGGTGPSRRDVTPEATLAVATREMPGFGEQMRAISGHFVPTAILSRQVGVLRETPDHAALIINLPGRPKAIAETLEGLKDEEGRSIVNGIFAAVPYCIDLIGGPYIETNDEVVKAFRPKNAQKPQKPAEKPEEKPEAPKGITIEGSDQPRSEEAVKVEVKAAEPVRAPEAPKAPVEPKPEPNPEPKPEPKPQPTPEPEPVEPFRANDLLMVSPRMSVRPPELTLLWLHGMGVDNRDFVSFADEILDFGGPACRMILPNAPVCEVSIHPGHALRAWYDIRHPDLEKNVDLFGIKTSARRIEALLRELEEKGLRRDRIVLGGFSQGAAIALYAGLRSETPLAGIAALSGYLPDAGRLYNEATPAGRRTPVFMGHGEFDSVVSPLIAERSARVIHEVNPNFEYHAYDMDHELCQEEMLQLATFLRHVAEG